MTKNITVSQNEITAPNGTTYRVGDIFIDSDGHYIRIREIDGETVRYDHSNRGRTWSSYGSEKIDYLSNKGWIRVDKTIPDLEDHALEIYNNLDRLFDEEDADDQVSDSVAITPSTTKGAAEALLRSVESRREMVEAARRIIHRKTEEMRYLVSRMEDKIARIRKIIAVFELYLGVYEEIVQIADGLAAPARSPIGVRQLVLYADEEFGDPRPKNGQRGIDWQSVEDFDDWLLRGGHWKTIVPEERCIVALKPSRQRRWYSSDPWFDAEAKAKNKMTYLLIRNGDKFFRIWTSVDVGERLYPTTDETDALFQILSQDSYYFEKRKAEDTQYQYARNAMILQGLLDRTDILQPIDHRINLFDPDTYHGLVDFIRDDEYTLPDGRPPFWDWLKRINGQLQAGSRVFVAVGSDRSSDFVPRKDYGDRFLVDFNEFNIPPLPKPDVYQLSLTSSPIDVEVLVPTGETHKTIDGEEKPTYRYARVKRRVLRIMYNPGDEVGTSCWGNYDPHERKNRISFAIFPDRDRFIINVDQIDCDDIDFYLNNRIARKEFLEMIPLLWGLKDWVASERQKEIDFVKLVSHRKQVDESLVWTCVSWWKFKNQWKRSLRDDDAKALRMIEKLIDRMIQSGGQLPADEE